MAHRHLNQPCPVIKRTKTSLLLFLFLLGLNISQVAKAQWDLQIEKNQEKIIGATWVRGAETVPAVPASFFKSSRKPLTIITAEAFDHALLIIPKRSRLDMFYGAAFLLLPGETLPAKPKGLQIEPMIDEDNAGPNGHYLVALAEDGFYFLQEQGSRLSINFQHLQDKSIETLRAVNASEVFEGKIKIELTAGGAVIQTGNNVQTYRPNGEILHGRFVFGELSAGNIDVIKGEFAGIDLRAASRQSIQEDEAYYHDLSNQLINGLNQQRRRNSLLWSKPGINLDRAVLSLASAIEKNQVPNLLGWQVFQMNWAQFQAGGEVDVSIMKMRKLFNAARLKKVILYFPNIEQLIGLGVDGNSTVNDASSAMIQDMQMGQVLLMGSSSLRGMARIRTHSAFHHLFNEIKVMPPKGDQLFSIVRNWADMRQRERHLVFSDELLAKLISLGNRLIADEEQPLKSLRCISDIANQYGVSGETPTTDTMANATYAMILEWMAKTTQIASLAPSEQFKEFLIWPNFKQAIDTQFVGHEQAKKALHRMLFNVIDGSQSTGANGVETGTQLLFFTGPSGVGKSYLPVVLSKMLKKKAQMSWPVKTWEGEQYKNEAAVNIMFGAPPGYVGYDESGGVLYQWVKTNPQSIMVFEELDKMNRAIHDSLYKVFDDGMVIDNSTSQEAYFTRGMIFLTSNFGSIPEAKLDAPGVEGLSINPKACEFVDDWDRWHIFGIEPHNPEVKNWSEEDLKTALIDKLRNSGSISPQMIGRIGRDNIVIFHHFSRENIAQIGAQALAGLQKKYAERNIQIEFAAELSDWLLTQAWGKNGSNAFDTGARSILRLIGNAVTSKISAYTSLNNLVNPGKPVFIMVELVVDPDNKGKKTVSVRLLPKD